MGSSNTKVAYTECIFKMQEEDIDEKLEFWNQFYTLPQSPDDVFSFIRIADIKAIKEKKPGNLAKLLRKLAHFVIQFASVSEQERHKKSREETLQLSNCVRLIDRLMPPLFDLDAQFVDSIFWEAPTKKEDKTDDEEIKVVAEVKKPETVTLAVHLINALMALHFFPNYTIAFSPSPQTKQTGEALPSNNYWAEGVGTKAVLAPSTVHLTHRAEVLKCLIACMSQSLYTKIEDFTAVPNKWLQYLVTTKSYYSFGLFCSLVNVACTYDPIGYGVPYNHLVFADYYEELTDLSLQVLNLVIQYDFNPKYESASMTKSTISDQSEKISSITSPDSPNVYIGYLREITKKDDFKFCLNALKNIIYNPILARNTYLPNSTKQVGCNQEVIMTLWRLFQENKFFLEYCCTAGADDLMCIVYSLLQYINDGRKDQGQFGLVHLSALVLLLLSGYREFSIALNRPVAQKVLIDLPSFSGSYADLLMQVLSRCLTDCHEKLSSLFECIASVLVNISPYVKGISLASAIKLLHLFEYFLKSSFLFGSETNYRFVFFMLEFFNNVIQYQYDGNHYLFYSLLRHQAAFNKLANLQLSDYKPKKPASPRPTEGTAETTAQPEEPPVNPFTPTEEWLASWKPQLPLATVMLMITTLSTQVQSMLTGSASDEAQIIDHLKTTTLVGILPVPHQFYVRRYQPNLATDIWFNVILWTLIYKRTVNPPLFSGTTVKLFTVITTNH